MGLNSLVGVDELHTRTDAAALPGVITNLIRARSIDHVTAIMVTHQLRDTLYVATHEAGRENVSPSFA